MDSNKLKFHLTAFCYTIFVWMGVQVLFDGWSAVSVVNLMSGVVFGLIFSFITEHRYSKLQQGGIAAPTFMGIFRRKKNIISKRGDLALLARYLEGVIDGADSRKKGSVVTVTTGQENTVTRALVEITKTDTGFMVRRPFSIWRDPTECEILSEKVVRAVRSW